MKTEEIIRLLDTMLRPELQDSYDNSGPQVLFRGMDVDSIMIALDADQKVIDEAVEKKCRLLVTHHPLFFKPPARIDSSEPISSLAIRLIDERLSVYSAHTNLDRIYRERLARSIGLVDIRPLGYVGEEGPTAMDDHGVRGRMDPPAGLYDVIETVKTNLALKHLILAGNHDGPIEHIAVLNGAGGRKIESIVASGDVDCIITGDVGYHQARYAQQGNVAVIDAGHFGTEIIFPGMLGADLHDFLKKSVPSESITIYIAESEKTPFTVY